MDQDYLSHEPNRLPLHRSRLRRKPTTLSIEKALPTRHSRKFFRRHLDIGRLLPYAYCLAVSHSRNNPKWVRLVIFVFRPQAPVLRYGENRRWVFVDFAVSRCRHYCLLPYAYCLAVTHSRNNPKWVRLVKKHNGRLISVLFRYS